MLLSLSLLLMGLICGTKCCFLLDCSVWPSADSSTCLAPSVALCTCLYPDEVVHCRHFVFRQVRNLPLFVMGPNVPFSDVCLTCRELSAWCLGCSLIQGINASACSVESYSEGWNNGRSVRSQLFACLPPFVHSMLT